MSKEQNGHDARIPLAPLPEYQPITAETKCGNCRGPLMNPDGALQKAEWTGEGWYHIKCLHNSNRQLSNAERVAESALPEYTREDYADEVAARFQNF